MTYFEDVKIKRGETLSKLATDYGYHSNSWQKIWQHKRNSILVDKRGEPKKLVEGDTIHIPIKWKITNKSLSVVSPNKYALSASRNGNKGKRIRWVQTVFGDNQSLHPTPFGVDWLDDNEPFYWTTSDLSGNSSYRKKFYDAPWRNPPTDRTTTWRAVLSIAIVTEKRVSIFNSIVWGVDFGKNGTNTPKKPRKASQNEVSGHLRLLRKGSGISQTFKAGGWTFRRAKN